MPLWHSQRKLVNMLGRQFELPGPLSELDNRLATRRQERETYALRVAKTKEIELHMSIGRPAGLSWNDGMKWQPASWSMKARRQAPRHGN